MAFVALLSLQRANTVSPIFLLNRLQAYIHLISVSNLSFNGDLETPDIRKNPLKDCILIFKIQKKKKERSQLYIKKQNKTE